MTSPLRLPALGLALSLILGGILFFLAYHAYEAGSARQNATQAAAVQAARELQQTPQRLAQDRLQARDYASLGRSGFLGEEDRLDWLGSLAQVRATLDLRRLGWRLSRRVPSSLSPGLYSSTMALEITPGDARHLAQFLARLRATAHGRFTVSGCTLLPDVDGHSVSCTLDWWTWHAR